ncbi:ComEC/Rec2 family competence protein [Dyadobacter fanqingshengii]|uniref:ComEC family competence protein n=1 Tax=Dyadobacter fanqingshengii TaxID=2906443 RepID=A0A9X1T9T8_9BACT|nr:ComEC/Rec2 family competence protein [Dyadobacter fanqingshengii]MCF0041001.1 ComEC family competence protein [Dyadobacter fanqingshengii]USJ37268.1 ComEC family competence protein [Dyadobacter fanqingshengii]
MLPRSPFVGIVLFYMTGILLSEIVPASDLSATLLITLSGLLLITCFILYFKSLKTAFGITFSLFLVSLGAFTMLTFERANDANIAALTSVNYSAYEAEIKSLPEKRTKSVRYEAHITRIKTQEGWVNVDLRALVNVSLQSSVMPEPGNKLIVRGTLDRPMAAQNPMQFDYRQYLRNKGIVGTDYLDEHSFQLVSVTDQSFYLTQWSTGISKWAAGVLRENVDDDAAYGLIKAMLLGRRDDLQSDQVSDYTTSGTVHILSVSGMHVAIIFLVISYLFGWMKRWPAGNFAYLALIIGLLGFYALVTGLPPSVQRATLMCIVFVMAEVFSRKQNAMNTLAFSALLILLVDPAAIYDVGFQLSYLAMSGIFLLYEPLKAIFNPANRILKFVWQISALSFAAQLATFPLSLFYFHQFPSYFWLVNPFVIAFTNVLLPAALVLLLVSPLHVFWLQWIVNKAVWLSAYLTNIAVAVPKSLPGYLVENLNLDKVEVVLLYAVLFTIWYGYHSGVYQYLKFSYLLVIVFATYSVSRSIQIRLSDQRVVHSVPKHRVVSFKKGSSLYVVSDKAFERDVDAYNFYIKNYATSQEISKTVFVTEK